jgi:hypothetical protein
MYFEAAYLSLLIISTTIGVLFFIDIIPRRNKNKIRFKKSIRKNVKSFFSDINNTDQDLMFRNVGIKLSIKKYAAIRNLMMIIMTITVCLSFIGGDLKEAKNLILLTIILYLASAPRDAFMGRKTPFKWTLEMIRSEYLNKKDDELIAVITQLKNLATLKSGQDYSADYIIQNLMRFTVIIKPILARTLSLMRLERKKEACSYFKNEIGTKLGDDFSIVLLKLDDLETSDFLNQLELFLETVKEKRATRQANKQQNLSYLVFLLASISVFCVFANFMYITFVDLTKALSF